MVVLTTNQQNFRWIRCCWFQASLDSINFSKMQAFGLFRGRMSSWPLPGQSVFLVFIQMYVPRWVGVSLSQMSISCSFSVAKCVYSMFFRLWGSWMILSGLEASLVLWFALGSTFAFVKFQWRVIVYMHGVDSWCAKHSLDSILLISGLARFNQFFQNAGFWPLPGHNVFLVFIQMYVSRWVGV